MQSVGFVTLPQLGDKGEVSDKSDAQFSTPRDAHFSTPSYPDSDPPIGQFTPVSEEYDLDHS